MNDAIYTAPWAERYASREMLELFSNQTRYQTWRTLWLYLAEAQKAAGLDISEGQLAQMRANLANIDFNAVRSYEKLLKHDVAAHIKAFGDAAPLARPIIHLGATSCYVTDNADLMIYRQALRLTAQNLAGAMAALASFARKYKDLPCLGFTHFQSAQAVTVGKRAAMWLQSLLFDLEDLQHVAETLPFRSIKGATGSAESFKILFNGDYEKFQQTARLIAQKAGFTRIQSVSGQTYDRKLDSRIAGVLNRLAEGVHKITGDIRLLQHMKELEEPFASQQVGSSAMAYKRNPMKSERAGSLAKLVLSLSASSSWVSATQWLERTLDDSACRRFSMPQAFLACDSILRLLTVIVEGLTVYPKAIEKNLCKELPFMATEKIMMEAVKKGGDRQEAHEAIRKASMQVAMALKEEGRDIDLLELLANEPQLKMNEQELRRLLEPGAFIGFCPQIVESFLNQEIEPALEPYRSALGKKIEIEI